MHFLHCSRTDCWNGTKSCRTGANVFWLLRQYKFVLLIKCISWTAVPALTVGMAQPCSEFTIHLVVVQQIGFEKWARVIVGIVWRAGAFLLSVARLTDSDRIKKVSVFNCRSDSCWLIEKDPGVSLTDDKNNVRGYSSHIGSRFLFYILSTVAELSEKVHFFNCKVIVDERSEKVHFCNCTVIILEWLKKKKKKEKKKRSVSLTVVVVEWSEKVRFFNCEVIIVERSEKVSHFL